ncbi:MAG TPA: hypothetical protein VGJ79_08925, partial [Candidatus Dormibacteraeota bacterium]
KAISPPANPLRVLGSYQGKGLEPPVPWSDGSVDVIIEPLEKNGRSLWDATGSGTITCQWFKAITPTGPDFSCRSIVITDTGSHLSTGTNILVPTTFAGHERRLVNSTLQPLIFGASTGSKITVAAGKTALLLSNGAGWERGTLDSTVLT